MKKRDNFQDFLDDLGSEVPLYVSKNSKCKIFFEKGKNSIHLTDLTIPSRFFMSPEDDDINSLKEISSENIFITLHEEQKSKKEKGVVSIISREGLSMNIHLFIEEKLFNFLISSIENSGKDFLHQLRFSVPIHGKDVKNINKNIKENKGYNFLLKNHKIIFTTDD